MPQKTSPQPLRVLVADNNRDVLDLFCCVLETMGYVVKTATDGDEAIETAKSFIPEVVFTAIVLGKQNGYAVCEKLRARPETAKALIVAITGCGMSFEEGAQTAGFDHFLVKPVALETMLETMQYLGGYRGNSVPELERPLRSKLEPNDLRS